MLPFLAQLKASLGASLASKIMDLAGGVAFGAHKPAKLSQHKVNLSPDNLKTLIPPQICHLLASKCSASWPNLGQSWGQLGFQKHGFSLGLALGAHKPAKISQHKVNLSPDSLKILIPT